MIRYDTRTTLPTGQKLLLHIAVCVLSRDQVTITPLGSLQNKPCKVYMVIVYILFSAHPPFGSFLSLASNNGCHLLFCCLVSSCTCIIICHLALCIHHSCGQSFLQVSAPCNGGGPTIPDCLPSWHHGL